MASLTLNVVRVLAVLSSMQSHKITVNTNLQFKQLHILLERLEVQSLGPSSLQVLSNF